MDERVHQLAEQLLATGLEKLSERERRVITRVAERSQISRDVNSVFEEKQTFGDRLADRVARFGGSWTFIILFLSTLAAWTVLNSVVLAWYDEAFDSVRRLPVKGPSPGLDAMVARAQEEIKAQ